MTITPEEIAAYRERLKLSQTELAELLPCSVWTIRQWEQGRRVPPDYLPRALRDLEREVTGKKKRKP